MRCEIGTDGTLWAAHEGTKNWVDVTEKTPRFLFETCTFGERTTLRDVLLLIQMHLPTLGPIPGNWTSDLVAEGLQPLPEGVEPTDLEFLYLSWEPSIDTYYGKDGAKGGLTLSGMAFPGFHGWGPCPGPEGGTSCSWGVALVAVNALAPLPIRWQAKGCLRDDAAFWEHIEARGQGAPASDPKLFETELEGMEATLGQILYGLVWELSFHGPPSSRDAFKGTLEQRVAEIEEAFAEEDVEEDLEEIETI